LRAGDFSAQDKNLAQMKGDFKILRRKIRRAGPLCLNRNCCVILSTLVISAFYSKEFIKKDGRN
jgi:hypothetical protein